MVAAAGDDEPPGFHGYWYVNLGYAGILLGSFLFGAFVAILHKLLRPSGNKNVLGWIIYWMVLIGISFFLRDGYVEFVLKERISWWFGILLLLLFATKKKAGISLPMSSA